MMDYWIGLGWVEVVIDSIDSSVDRVMIVEFYELTWSKTHIISLYKSIVEVEKINSHIEFCWPDLTQYPLLGLLRIILLLWSSQGLSPFYRPMYDFRIWMFCFCFGSAFYLQETGQPKRNSGQVWLSIIPAQ